MSSYNFFKEREDFSKERRKKNYIQRVARGRILADINVCPNI